MALSNPENMNFLSPLNFRFQLKRSPSLNFFIQKINIPGLSMGPVIMPNPLLGIPIPGDHLTYEELNISFKVDENLQNYLEVHNWLRALGKPSFSEYRDMAAQLSFVGESLVSDISLTILTSHKNPNYEIVFKDAFPVSLNSLEFSSVETDVDFMQASASFKYTIFEVVKTT